MVKTSGLFSLDWNDLLKGGVMAIGTAVGTVIENSFEAGTFDLNWTNIWHVAALATTVYLMKNLFTTAKIQTNAVDQ